MTSQRDELLQWYDEHRRDLPWRRMRDPYATWVSEIMLQQTRVDTVIPYFERFLVRFPTPVALAEAPEEDVMSLWSGLGYYRRARLLHRGAKEVVERYGGVVPRERKERERLPGIGRYTAGAIGSIAFGLREPIVDGNVARVFSRLEGIEEPVSSGQVQRTLWRLAERWVEGDRPGDLNQALMELGALVCTPRSPSCLTCPLTKDCVARIEGRQHELPNKTKKKAPKTLELVAVVATSGKELWLQKSEVPLFQGLWNPPFIETSEGIAGRKEVQRLLRDLGLKARLNKEPAGRGEHLLTHRRLRVQVWRALGTKGTLRDGLRSFEVKTISELGISAFGRKVIDAAGL